MSRTFILCDNLLVCSCLNSQKEIYENRWREVQEMPNLHHAIIKRPLKVTIAKFNFLSFGFNLNFFMSSILGWLVDKTCSWILDRPINNLTENKIAETESESRNLFFYLQIIINFCDSKWVNPFRGNYFG